MRFTYIGAALVLAVALAGSAQAANNWFEPPPAPAPTPVDAASLPPDQDASTTLRFPAIWSAGLAWMPTSAWTAEVTANFTEWSVFRDLPIHFLGG